MTMMMKSTPLSKMPLFPKMRFLTHLLPGSMVTTNENLCSKVKSKNLMTMHAKRVMTMKEWAYLVLKARTRCRWKSLKKRRRRKL